jgi:WD40 repeat protein
MYQLVKEREQYAFSERHCRRLLSSNPACVQRMELQQKLEGHNGCVNTVSFDTEAGDILVSGSDDMQIKLWDWERGGWAAGIHFAAGSFSCLVRGRCYLKLFIHQLNLGRCR